MWTSIVTSRTIENGMWMRFHDRSRVIGMDRTSNVEGGLSDYTADAGAMAATLDADAVPRLGGAWLAGADVRVSASDSSSGLDYDPTNKSCTGTGNGCHTRTGW